MTAYWRASAVNASGSDSSSALIAIPSRDAEDDAEEGAADPQQYRFGEHQPQDVEAVVADSTEDADLLPCARWPTSASR